MTLKHFHFHFHFRRQMDLQWSYLKVRIVTGIGLINWYVMLLINYHCVVFISVYHNLKVVHLRLKFKFLKPVPFVLNDCGQIFELL